jgi:hypothetical protein
MALRTVPFGAFGGFAAVDKQGVTCYYSQGLTASLLGIAAQYTMQNKIDSGTVSGMGTIKYFAKANGALYAQDDNGNILKEGTPGAYNFTIVHSPGGVVVHEMIHLIEPTHNDRFLTILGEHYPTWREARAELNELPLAAESWKE